MTRGTGVVWRRRRRRLRLTVRFVASVLLETGKAKRVSTSGGNGYSRSIVLGIAPAQSTGCMIRNVAVAIVVAVVW